MRSKFLTLALILCGSFAGGFVANRVPSAPADDSDLLCLKARSLRLVSPDGKREILLKATNEIAGVWLTGAEKHTVAIWSDQRAGAVGIYGDEANAGKGCSIAISAEKTGPAFQWVNPKDGATRIFAFKDLDRLKDD